MSPLVSELSPFTFFLIIHSVSFINFPPFISFHSIVKFIFFLYLTWRSLSNIESSLWRQTYSWNKQPQVPGKMQEYCYNQISPQFHTSTFNFYWLSSHSLLSTLAQTGFMWCIFFLLLLPLLLFLFPLLNSQSVRGHCLKLIPITKSDDPGDALYKACSPIEESLM